MNGNRAPEDVEPVAYKVCDKKAGEVYAVLWHTPNYDPEQYDVIPLYRAPHPAKPIEVTDQAVSVALGVWCGSPTDDPSDWADWKMGLMRAAIEAALKEASRG